MNLWSVRVFLNLVIKIPGQFEGMNNMFNEFTQCGIQAHLRKKVLA